MSPQNAPRNRLRGLLAPKLLHHPDEKKNFGFLPVVAEWSHSEAKKDPVMKTQYLIPVISLALASPSFGETLAEKLERGVQLQETQSDHQAAIEAYQGVIEAGNDTTDVIAEARFRLAECYLNQGDREKAEEQLKALRDKFPSDNPWVKGASKILRNGPGFLPAPFSEKGRYFGYDIKIPSGKIVGSMYGAIHKTTHDGKPVWQSFFGRVFFGRESETRSFSTCYFDEGTFHPIKARNFFPDLGDRTTTFGSDGTATTVGTETGEEIVVIELPEEVSSLFDNDQVVQLLRALPLEIGSEITLQLNAPLSPVAIPFKLEPVGTVTLKTPAGEFECVKVESNINQTFYISLDENRYLAQMDIGGGAKVTLATVEDWNPNSAPNLKAKHLPFQVTLPEGSFWHPAQDDKDRYRVVFACADFLVQGGRVHVALSGDVEPPATESARAFAKHFSEKMANSFNSLELDKGSWEDVEIAGMNGVLVTSKAKKGEIESRIYHAYAIGDTYAVALQLQYLDKNREAVRKRIIEIADSIKLD